MAINPMFGGSGTNIKMFDFMAAGLPTISTEIGARGIESPGGGLDMIWVTGILFAGFGIGAVLFYGLGGRSKRVHQLDNYAGGHFLTADTRYQYSNNFYPALARLIGPLYRDSFRWLESGLMSLLQFVSAGAQGIYRAVHPSMFLLATVVLVLYVWGAE